MLNRIIIGLFLTLAMLVAVSAAEAAAQTPDAQAGAADAMAGRHLLWKVTGPRGTAYLVGSIHFGTPDMYPLPEEMTRAYGASQALVVEANLVALDPTRMAQVVAAKAMYSDGTTLSQVLTPQTWKELDEVLKKFGASAQMVERQKPWFVSLTLTSLALRRFGFSEDLGIDNHFMKLAKNNKPIIGLETFQQQLDFLDGFSYAEQEQMLKETFEDIDKGTEFLTDTLRAWKSGDAQQIDDLMNEELRSGGDADKHMYKVLVADRNVTMADKLEGLLKRGGSYFVVLGAAHFVGKDGIVELLKAKGYQVQQH